MNRAMLSLIATMLLAPATSRAQAISTKPPSEAKIRLLVNVNYNLTERNFAESSTFTSFLETGSENRSYAGGTGLAFELGGIYSITGSIGIMGSFELLSAEHDAIFEVNEPHPLLFNQNRSISSELTALEYQEQALHIDFVYSVESGSMTIDVFGGPTSSCARRTASSTGATSSRRCRRICTGRATTSTSSRRTSSRR